MAIEKKSRSISKATAALLRGGETGYVDFKRSPDGVHADDLVAFANGERGGDILVGVAEAQNDDGSQSGVIVGCDIGDAAVLQILNKAISCVPPVAIKVYAENTGAKPFLRINIPSSENRPHSTAKGVYCRRDGSRNRPLHPAELLQIFLDNEGRAFAQRFEDAAGKITDELADLQAALDQRITSIGDQLGWAEYKVGDTEDTVDTILAYVRRLTDEANDTAARLRMLFRQDERDDPVRALVRKKLLDKTIEQLSGDPELIKRIEKGDRISMTAEGKAALELEEADLKNILFEALDAVRLKTTPAQEAYRIVVKEPSKSSETELKEFIRLVIDGGEVARGLEVRVRRATRLAFLYYSDVLVGTAALKNPYAGYRNKVFRSAASDRPPTDYPLELGWIYIAPEHRGRRKTVPLIEAAINGLDGSRTFATTRENNKHMHHILERLKFARTGAPYASQQDKGESIVLYLRDGLTKASI